MKLALSFGQIWPISNTHFFCLVILILFPVASSFSSPHPRAATRLAADADPCVAVAQLHHLPSHGLQDLSPIQRVHQDGANPTAALCSAAVQPSPCCLPRRRSSFIHRSGDRNGAYRFLFCSNWCESSIRFDWGVGGSSLRFKS